MDKFTLRQLRYFDALARHSHFGRAAAASAVSQPALSVQIKELEESWGAPLFERGSRQVRLTAFGEEMLTRTREILSSIDVLGDVARTARNQPLSRLRLGIIPTIAPYLLPRLIGRLTQVNPGLELQVRETLTPRLLQELDEGRLDAAILALPVSEPLFEEVALFTEDFVLVRHHDDAANPVPDGESLRKMRLLLLEEGHCFRDQALSFCNLQSALPRDGLDGSSLTTLVQMVGAGIGVTLIPEMALAVEGSAANVSVARFPKPSPSRTVGMIWRKSTPLADHLRALSDTIRDVAAPPHGLQSTPDIAS